MDASNGRRIEVFAPFSAAMDLTKLILFQPFDLGKWFTIGFAAFLAHLSGGWGNGFNYNKKFGAGDWKWNMRSATHDAFGNGGDGIPAWMIPLILIAVLLVIALVVVMLWLGARGKFIFTDCVVRNRGAIVEPWHEFKRQGNSYFLFTLVVGACTLTVLGLVSIPIWLPFALHGGPPKGVVLVLGLVSLGIAFVILALVLNVVLMFMVPVMYRRKCGAMEGFRAALTAITTHPGPVILYVLFSIVLWIAIALVACLATCLTCCITAIPYLGTVILLPLYVFMMAYMLLFVRQFGNDYDAWGNIVAVPPPAPTVDPVPPIPPTPPPLQA